MVWRYSIPRFIRQPTKICPHPPLFDTLRHGISRVWMILLIFESIITASRFDLATRHASFNLLNGVAAGKIRKTKEEFSEWMSTTDTIALTVSVSKYARLLGCGVRRTRLIGDSSNSVIRVIPPNVKVLFIIFDYNTNSDKGKEALLSDMNPACDPNLKPLQTSLSDALSLAWLLNRFEIKYKATGRENQ